MCLRVCMCVYLDCRVVYKPNRDVTTLKTQKDRCNVTILKREYDLLHRYNYCWPFRTNTYCCDVNTNNGLNPRNCTLFLLNTNQFQYRTRYE